jgi:hypothetical protein
MKSVATIQGEFPDQKADFQEIKAQTDNHLRGFRSRGIICFFRKFGKNGTNRRFKWLAGASNPPCLLGVIFLVFSFDPGG